MPLGGRTAAGAHAAEPGGAAHTAAHLSVPTALCLVQVSIPIQNGRTADFTTTYLSPRLRVAKGSSGNIFLFERQGQA